LYYVIPLEQSFRVSLTVRANEKEILLKDQELKELEKLLKSAKKISEGYALQLNVTGKEDYKIVSELINKIIALRK